MCVLLASELVKSFIEKWIFVDRRKPTEQKVQPFFLYWPYSLPNYVLSNCTHSNARPRARQRRNATNVTKWNRKYANRDCRQPKDHGNVCRSCDATAAHIISVFVMSPGKSSQFQEYICYSHNSHLPHWIASRTQIWAVPRTRTKVSISNLSRRSRARTC